MMSKCIAILVLRLTRRPGRYAATNTARSN